MDAVGSLFDPLAFVLVWCGSFIVAGMQESWSGLRQALFALAVLRRADPVRDAQLARQSLYRVEQMIDLKGLFCVDRAQSELDYVTRLTGRLASESDLRGFRQWVSADLDDREARHNRAIRCWMTVADIAPAMGMVGTIIGLVQMFGGITDPDRLGEAMALALLTTLYGLLLSNLIAAPIAHRLLRISSEELKWQRILSDRLFDLAQRDKAREGGELRPVAA